MKKVTIIIVSFVLLLIPLCTVYAGGGDDDYTSDGQLNFNEAIMEEIGASSDEKIPDCNSLLGDPNDDVKKEPAFFLQKIFDVMKYVAIVLIIVFTYLDFLGTVGSKDDDKLKKSVSKLITRFIICVVIFVLPMILEFVFTMVEIYSPSVCNIR